MSLLLEGLLLPFTFDFMREALWVGVVIAALCAWLSCFVVLKGWALAGDAISHGILPGVVIGHWLGVPMVLGAVISALGCVLGAGAITSRCRIKEDAVLGIAMTGFLALGLVLIAASQSTIHYMHILLGNLLGVEAHVRQQVWLMSAMTAALLVLKHRDLVLYCFDASQAAVLGMPVARLHLLLLTLLAMTSVVGLQAVGVVLVVAMLITPGSTAFLWTRRFVPMVMVAMGTAVISVMLGLWASFYANVETGAAIVLAQSGFFLVSFLLAPRKGVLARYLSFRRAVRTDRRRAAASCTD
ncbi:metal ABC transporter permease [Larsenimonas rhizosphaerae]|uniref:Metal ABC transporter permease n=1 Tax=Larsenimonas rhizosphaerae TaxID=2944682 RepID=A0AA42CX09_9GAMM|nr:metal ABC transporter permease [Larsenimonas rhizosphaerae]MCX2523325.1 metal ABC transporter permease [Larsenimonas rhizosphaerae]